MVIIEAET